MRVVITGATGNVGTSLVERLAGDDTVTEIVGVARRKTAWNQPKRRSCNATSRATTCARSSPARTRSYISHGYSS